MAKARKRSGNGRGFGLFLFILIISALIGTYVYLANFQDLALTTVKKIHSEKVAPDVRHTYKLTVWNGYYNQINLHFELPSVWLDQGVSLDNKGADLLIPPFQKREIEVTLQVPLDLIEESELPIELVKSVERGGQNPIIKSLTLTVSALADEAPK